MEVKIEEVEKNRVKLEIAVGADVLEEGLEKSYKKNAKRFNIPGFRKGRAPRSMVERQYGAAVLYEGAIDAICPECYEKAVKENGIDPVDAPELDLVELEKGKPFVFTATVYVKPEVKLGQYKGVEAARRHVVVTEDDVLAELMANADKNARLVPPAEERASREGDTLLIDFTGYIDGEQFEGGKREGFNIELGSRTLIKGFEEQLIGRGVGENFNVGVRFPEDYQDPVCRGKEAEFDVTVHSIKEKELPEIDDEFAQDVSEFDDLESYKADIRRELTERQEKAADDDFEDAVFGKVFEGAEIDIPEVMVKKQAERNLKEFEMRLAYQGVDVERYMQMTSSTREQLEESMRARSTAEVRAKLVLDQIAKEEAVEVTDGEFDDELKKRAEKYNRPFEEYKSQLSDDYADYVRSQLKLEKVKALIIENAVKI